MESVPAFALRPGMRIVRPAWDGQSSEVVKVEEFDTRVILTLKTEHRNPPTRGISYTTEEVHCLPEHMFQTG